MAFSLVGASISYAQATDSESETKTVTEQESKPDENAAPSTSSEQEEIKQVETIQKQEFTPEPKLEHQNPNESKYLPTLKYLGEYITNYIEKFKESVLISMFCLRKLWPISTPIL